MIVGTAFAARDGVLQPAAALAALAASYLGDLDIPVGPLLVGDRAWDVDVRPAIMGCINLSRDSTYRESVAVASESAIRKARVMVAQGADFVDVGAESSTASARRVSTVGQIAARVSRTEQLNADGILVSHEKEET